MKSHGRLSAGFAHLSAGFGDLSAGFVLPKKRRKETRKKIKIPRKGSPSCAINWVLPEDYCEKDPCYFNTEMFVSKVGNPCPTLGQLLASRILYTLLVAEKQYEITRARFCIQSCTRIGQLLVNSPPTHHSMGSCSGLPCSIPLATPD